MNKRTLQRVLAEMTDDEALAVWNAIAATVENDEDDGDLSPLRGLMDRLDAIVADAAGDYR